MWFPVAGAAAAAAAALGVTDTQQRRATSIPRHPDAAASAFNMAQGAIVESFTSHGLYVLYQWLQTNKPAETATELIGRTLDLQGPRIDQFVPTDPSRLASLSVDPNGLLAHRLPASPYAVTPDIGGYSAAAAHVVDQLAAQEIAAGAILIQGVACLPSAKCLDAGASVQRTQPRFHSQPGDTLSKRPPRNKTTCAKGLRLNA